MKSTAFNLFFLRQSHAQVPKDTTWLSPREREIAAGLKFRKRRNDWLLGRWTAKQVLLRLFRDEIAAEKLASLEIIAAPDGAPEAWFSGRPLDATISITHSHATAVCLAAPGKMAIGCDLEKIEPRSPAFVRDYFTEFEMSLVFAAAEAVQPFLANLVWSAKESALKALREGLRLDTRRLQFSSPLISSEQTAGEFHIDCSTQQQRFLGRWMRIGEFVLTFVAAQKLGQLVDLTH